MAERIGGFIFAFIIIFIIGTGCGGLLPPPKFLEGDIQNNTYLAKDGLFSVSVPHKEGSREYEWMRMKEQYPSGTGAYVSFGPAALNQRIYRVEVAMRTTPESEHVLLDDIAPRMIESYEQQLQAGSGTAPVILEHAKTRINGRDARYWKLTQEVPAGKYWRDSSAVFVHHAYVIDFGIGVGIVWVQVPDDPFSREARLTVGSPGDARTHEAALPPREFAESLILMPNNALPAATDEGDD